MATHTFHQGPMRVLDDGCEECVARSGDLDGLSHLDSKNLRSLGELAAETHGRGVISKKPDDASYADMKAVETLRHAGRIVFASGITEEVAR